MTPSTTNTAAREFYRCVECKRFGYAETPCVKCGGITTPPTLTQQQGGEQEAAWQNIETAEVEFLNNLAEKGGLADPVPGMLRHCARLIAGKRPAVVAPDRYETEEEGDAYAHGYVDGEDAAALRTKQPAASEGDGQGIDDRALDAALMAARNATWDIGEDASHSSAEKIALAVLAALRTPASEGDGGRVVVTDEMVERAADAYEAAAESEGFGRVDGSERVTHLRFIRAAIDAALIAKSAAYDALVARAYQEGWHECAEWAGRDDLHPDVDSKAYEVARDKRLARLLVSDDRPSHTAGDGNG